VATSRTFRGASVVVVAALVTGCSSVNPSPPPTGTPTSSSPLPTASPIPTATVPTTFPLAVVTGITNLKATITVNELTALAQSGNLVIPCAVDVVQPALAPTRACVWPDEIAAAVEGDQKLVALLPPGLVEPATKVLPIAGDGPFGLFGPDLFGDPTARAMEYPVIGSAEDPFALEPAWTAYDASKVWTLTAVGSLCADRSGAKQAVTLGKGWDWIFNGGTARYKGKPILNPATPVGIGRFPIVQPVDTGHAGTLASIVKRSDVALGDHKCPILPTANWRPATGNSVSLSVPEDVLPRWRDFLGLDAVYLPADHQGDRGVTGIRSTLRLVDKYSFPRTGLGLTLDEALEPAYVEVAGLKVAFVSWNEVPGPPHADADSPGVAWLTKANVDAAVHKATAGGADLIICDPQWWGGSEYHPNLWATQKTALGWMDKAGCDQVLGGGLHVTGGLFFRQHAKGVSIVDAGPGNFQFGQDWWQETQEGVIVELTFHGKTLVNVRLHPYVMILAARPSLLDPEGDGHYVLQRTWKNSEVDYAAASGGP
jgi:hypothetical protein